MRLRRLSYNIGGTSFGPAFDYLSECTETFDVHVVLTDGHASTEDIDDSSVPTVWLSTARDEYPFGDVIKFDITDQQ